MFQPTSIKEKEWLHLLKQGDQSALRHIFDQYYKYLLVTACNITNDNEKAKDLVQDIFFELWKKREQLEIQSSLKSYLRRAVVNRCLNYLKSQKRFDFGDDHLDLEKSNAEISAHKQLETNDLQEAIQLAIDGLPDRCRTIFMLSRFENLSHKEIAAKLEISTKTIENQMTKALKILRAAVEKYDLLGLLGFVLNFLG